MAQRRVSRGREIERLLERPDGADGEVEDRVDPDFERVEGEEAERHRDQQAEGAAVEPVRLQGFILQPQQLGDADDAEAVHDHHQDDQEGAGNELSTNVHVPSRNQWASSKGRPHSPRRWRVTPPSRNSRSREWPYAPITIMLAPSLPAARSIV